MHLRCFKKTLEGNCILIGSYARFTAITPLHDVDVLFIAGDFDSLHIDPQTVLTNLERTLRTNFKNPTEYQIEISQQTHSITIAFNDDGEEKFAADIVPAYRSGLENEFGDAIYYVPQILNTNRRYRQQRYAELDKSMQMEIDWWIKSDPRGYIKITSELNAQNDDFRKTVKFVKRWKHNCKEKYEDFEFKSFHIEQVIIEIYKKNTGLEIIDVIFKFFCDIPTIISKPRIKDRADQGKFIDEYLSSLTEEQKAKIIEARDHFLIELENLTPSKPISSLLVIDFYKRACLEEQYLFDSLIPTFIDDGLSLRIEGYLRRRNGFREYAYKISNHGGRVDKENRIKFRIEENTTSADSYKWKVKNDNSCIQPRGEITDNQTRRDPEKTLYDGNHCVECYAIRNNVCVAKSMIRVII